MKQKHRMIWERRHGRECGPEPGTSTEHEDWRHFGTPTWQMPEKVFIEDGKMRFTDGNFLGQTKGKEESYYDKDGNIRPKD